MDKLEALRISAEETARMALTIFLNVPDAKESLRTLIPEIEKDNSMEQPLKDFSIASIYVAIIALDDFKAVG